MLRVNKKIEYALMALKFMSERGAGQLTSAREICDHFQTPFDTTAKVMQIMNTHGILRSVKGIKGGYELAKDLENISFQSLEFMIEGPEESICETKNGPCELQGACNIAGPLQRLNFIINQYLGNLTLKELLVDELSLMKKTLSPEEGRL